MHISIRVIKIGLICLLLTIGTTCFAQTSPATSHKPGIFDEVFDTSSAFNKDTVRRRPTDPVSNYLNEMTGKIMPFVNFVEAHKEGVVPSAADKYAKAEALEKSHQYEQALKLYDELVHEHPELPMPFVKIMALVERLNRSNESPKSFLKQSANNLLLLKWAYYNFALDELYKPKPNLKLTVSYLQAAIGIDSTIGDYKVHRGLWSYYTGDYKQSILDLETTQAASGHLRALSLCCLADSYAALKDPVNCKKYYQLFQTLKSDEKIEYAFVKTTLQEFVQKSTNKIGSIGL